MMMISPFLRVGAAILALSLASPYGHVKAEDGGGRLDCGTETLTLVLENSDLSEAYINWVHYFVSSCDCSPDPICPCTVTFSAHASHQDITFDFTNVTSYPLFVAYKDACLNATGNPCSASIDGKVTGPYYDSAMEIALHMKGIPSCMAQVCDESDIETMFTSSVEYLSDLLFGSDAQTDFLVTNVTCEM